MAARPSAAAAGAARTAVRWVAGTGPCSALQLEGLEMRPMPAQRVRFADLPK